ncbi:MAG: YcfL family protein [bacterium]|nr:YcfL family protein [bacterium]
MRNSETANRFYRSAIMVVTGLALSVLTACASAPRQQFRYESYKLTADATLATQDIVVVKSDWSREAGRMRASVRVRNASSQLLTLRYRFNWLDQARKPVGAEDSQWQTVEARGGEIVLLEGITIATGAADFTLEFEGDGKQGS